MMGTAHHLIIPSSIIDEQSRALALIIPNPETL